MVTRAKTEAPLSWIRRYLYRERRGHAGRSGSRAPFESTAAIPTSSCKTALSAICAQVSQSIFEMSAYTSRVNRLTGRLSPRLSLRVRPELADLNLPRRRNSGTTNSVNS